MSIDLLLPKVVDPMLGANCPVGNYSVAVKLL